MAESSECPSFPVSQEVCLEADIRVDPKVACGPLAVTCRRSGAFPPSRRPLARRKPSRKGACRIRVFQEMRVAVPVVFAASMDCRVGRCVTLYDTFPGE
jgi:hypothetical protein